MFSSASENTIFHESQWTASRIQRYLGMSYKAMPMEVKAKPYFGIHSPLLRSWVWWGPDRISEFSNHFRWYYLVSSRENLRFNLCNVFRPLRSPRSPRAACARSPAGAACRSPNSVGDSQPAAEHREWCGKSPAGPARQRQGSKWRVQGTEHLKLAPTLG